ncbi:YggS family pyridoxal phosphate-dependent enzyme [Bacteroidota bacterium]
MNIADNLNLFKSELVGTGCRLIAVSKTKPEDMILKAYNSGHRIFGENKVQDLVAKAQNLPSDIMWHMIGHLQRNKVKYVAPFVSMIHSVDSVRLLAEINKQAAKNERVIDCLFQVHIAEEETKFGLSSNELLDMVKNPELKDYENIRIVGLMGMATYTDDELQIRKEFRFLSELFYKIQSEISAENIEMMELSMGMTSDYKIAIEEGSTLIRIGTAIFGARNYT